LDVIMWGTSDLKGSRGGQQRGRGRKGKEEKTLVGATEGRGTAVELSIYR